MAEEGPQQGDSDVVVEEEVEENMETDEPPNVDAPTPIPDKAVLETSEPKAEDDRQSHVLEESTSVTFRWLKKALSKVTPTSLWRRK